MPRGTIVFRRFGGRRHARVHAGTRLPGPHAAGVLIADPLPPFGVVAVTSWLPVSLSPRGVLSYVAFAFNPGARHDQVERWVPFDAIRTIERRDRDIVINGTRLVRAASAALASRLAASIRDLASRPETDRAAHIDRVVEQGFDLRAAGDRLALFERVARPLRRLAILLLVHLFVVVPVVLRLRGLIATWPWLLAATLAIAAIVAWRFGVAHARLHPEGALDRWGTAVAMVLCPPLAARAPVLLSRDLFDFTHPLAAAVTLCPGPDHRRLAAALLLDARHPIRPVCPSPDDEARAAEAWFRDRMLLAIERFAAGVYGDVARLPPPVTPQPGGRAFCPRCRSQYREAEGACADCGGLPLVALRDATGE